MRSAVFVGLAVGAAVGMQAFLRSIPGVYSGFFFFMNFVFFLFYLEFSFWVGVLGLGF